VPVQNFQPVASDSWSFWSQPWTPEKPGRYLIRLRLRGLSTVTRRQDSGYYLRSVEITEI
jgi:hypothetical protein